MMIIRDLGPAFVLDESNLSPRSRIRKQELVPEPMTACWVKIGRAHV